MILASDNTISYANHAVHEHVGLPVGSLVGGPLPDEVMERVSVSDDLTQAPDQILPELAEGESAEVLGQIIRYSHPDGSERWSSLSTTVIPAVDGGAESVVLVIDDVTDRHEQTRLLAHQAMHDSLTGLPNRSAMLEFLTGALARQERRSDQVCGVLFCDLDGFKDVNDTLGHHTGNEVLLTVAHRIHKACRAADRVGRLGGDEFIVVLEGLHHPVETGTVADRIITSVAEPIFVGDVEVRLGVSIGVALSHGDEDTEAVLSRSDAALYEAKGAGRGTWRSQAWLDSTAPTSRV
jgi:diguanylate cyclase (GGDEF)-like protein/PAS domain S-box-containing protein